MSRFINIEEDTSTEKKTRLAIQEIIDGKLPTIAAAASKYYLDANELYQNSFDILAFGKTLSALEYGPIDRFIYEKYAYGNPATSREVKEFTRIYLNTLNRKRYVTDIWLNDYLREHFTEVFRYDGFIIPRFNRYGVEKLRDRTLSHITNDFFDSLEKFIKAEDIDKEDIWHFDESRYVFGSNKDKTIFSSSNKSRIYVRPPKNKDRCTVIEAISAAGQKLPPLFVFDGKCSREIITHIDSLSCYYSLAEVGLLTPEISYKWLKEVFNPITRPVDAKKRILILYGHMNYLNTFFIDRCMLESIICLFIPYKAPDFFDAMPKRAFSPIVEDQQGETTGEVLPTKISSALTVENFIKMYQEARNQMITKELILHAWKEYGIFPRDRTKVLSRIVDKPKKDRDIDSVFDSIIEKNIKNNVMEVDETSSSHSQSPDSPFFVTNCSSSTSTNFFGIEETTLEAENMVRTTSENRYEHELDRIRERSPIRRLSHNDITPSDKTYINMLENQVEQLKIENEILKLSLDKQTLEINELRYQRDFKLWGYDS
ncbi:Transposase [Candida maltosa Xu316]|uniref:Transposase n=1 Tax=Candida maltosa (strain Xu316) TaxID=1245528 RepID=M3JV29_CANMX|nr:Transposase [Candida maltosa Xu316]